MRMTAAQFDALQKRSPPPPASPAPRAPASEEGEERRNVYTCTREELREYREQWTTETIQINGDPRALIIQPKRKRSTT